MNQQETIELFERCEAARAKARAEAVAAGKEDAEAAAHEAAKAIWNAWANEMLAKRKALEEAGEWAENEETRAWMDAAAIDFSHLRFQCGALEHENEPPSTVMAGLDPAIQGGQHTANMAIKSIRVEGESIRFDGFVFPGAAGFEGAKFSGDARFVGAQFSGDARFGEAKFSGTARFGAAQFSVYAGFGGAQFSGTARFEGAQFSGEARFEGAKFSGDAWFGGAQFSGDATFFMAKFVQFATFANAHFHKNANFGAIRGERGFSLRDATFDTVVPGFIQAHFEEAPRLDYIKLPADIEQATSKYRALKRLAIQGHDHEREHQFFKSELLSRRASKEDPLAIRIAITLYGWLSDFGRSFARPLLMWVALIGIFAGIYWLSARPLACSGAPGHSLYLSAKNGLVVLGGAKDQRVTDAYLCLYGEQFTTPATAPDPQIAPAKPTPTGSPDIPGLITLMEFVQSVFSVILLFLVAFGIRNQFRIK